MNLGTTYVKLKGLQSGLPDFYGYWDIDAVMAVVDNKPFALKGMLSYKNNELKGSPARIDGSVYVVVHEPVVISRPANAPLVLPKICTLGLVTDDGETISTPTTSDEKYDIRASHGSGVFNWGSKSSSIGSNMISIDESSKVDNKIDVYAKEIGNSKVAVFDGLTSFNNATLNVIVASPHSLFIIRGNIFVFI